MDYLNNLLNTLRKLEPLIALLILIFLIVIAFYLPKQIKLNEQIKNTCGWENEQVKCVCEKKFVEDSGIFNLNEGTPVENVSLVR